MEQKQLKYSKLMEDLREKMMSGEIQAGDRLPSEMNYRLSIRSADRRCARLFRCFRMKAIFTRSMGEEPSVPSGSYIRDIPIILP